jgi:HEAT repeat protein
MKGDDVESVRAQVAWALGGVGKGSRTAVAALTAALKQREFSVRYYAARALFRIDREAAAAQKTGDVPNIRIEVAVALGEFGKDATPAIPALTALLRDTNPVIRNLATNALLKLDLKAAAKAGLKEPSR